jgi:hypothetical protein
MEIEMPAAQDRDQTDKSLLFSPVLPSAATTP